MRPLYTHYLSLSLLVEVSMSCIYILFATTSLLLPGLLTILYIKGLYLLASLRRMAA